VSSSHRFGDATDAPGPQALVKRPSASSMAPTGAVPAGDVERGPEGAKGPRADFKSEAPVQPEQGSESESASLPEGSGLHTTAANGVGVTLPQPLGGVARSSKGSSGSLRLSSASGATATGGRTVWVAPATTGSGTPGNRPLSHPQEVPVPVPVPVPVGPNTVATVNAATSGGPHWLDSESALRVPVGPPGPQAWGAGGPPPGPPARASGPGHLERPLLSASDRSARVLSMVKKQRK
jgi:hypothetical protein